MSVISPTLYFIYVGGFFPGGTPLLVLELKLGLSLVMPFLSLKLAVVCVTSVLVFQFKFVSKPKGTIENKENVFKRKKTIIKGFERFLLYINECTQASFRVSAFF